MRPGGDAILSYERIRTETVAFRLFEIQLRLERAVAPVLSHTRSLTVHLHDNQPAVNYLRSSSTVNAKKPCDLDY